MRGIFFLVALSSLLQVDLVKLELLPLCKQFYYHSDISIVDAPTISVPAHPDTDQEDDDQAGPNPPQIQQPISSDGEESEFLNGLLDCESGNSPDIRQCITAIESLKNFTDENKSDLNNQKKEYLVNILRLINPNKIIKACGATVNSDFESKLTELSQQYKALVKESKINVTVLNTSSGLFTTFNNTKNAINAVMSGHLGVIEEKCNATGSDTTFNVLGKNDILYSLLKTSSGLNSIDRAVDCFTAINYYNKCDLYLLNKKKTDVNFDVRKASCTNNGNTLVDLNSAFKDQT
ncbi:MAG: hypothetical protein MHPSP_000770 [Paramarteilia canceri]